MFKQQFLIINFLFVFVIAPMELVTSKNINYLPDELLKAIVIPKHHKYPWENFIHARQLGQVCMRWNSLVSNADQLAQELKIPLMHCAAMMNDAEKLIDLKLAGHSQYIFDKQKRIPLHYALARRQIASATIIYLLCRGFDISQLTHSEQKFIQSLAPKPAIASTEEDLIDAVEREDYDATVAILFKNLGLLRNMHQKLVEKADSFNNDKLSKLLRYCMQSIVEMVLHARIACNEPIEEGLFLNFRFYKANPNAYNHDGKTLLHCIAVDNDRNHFLPMLFQLEGIDGTKIDFMHGLNPLQMAVRYDNSECMDFLINKGAKMHCVTNNGQTLLHLAAYYNSSECLTRLIKLMPEQINTKDMDGYSPLITSLRIPYPVCTIDLIEAGADFAIKDNNGQTALHFAANRNLSEVINLLIARGADVNCTSNANFILNDIHYGLYTPLHYAACRGCIAALDSLLRCGADVTLKTQTGKTFGELLVNRLVEKDIFTV